MEESTEFEVSDCRSCCCLTLKIPAPEKRFWTRSGSKPKIGGKSNFYHFYTKNKLKNGLKTLQIAIIDGSLVLPILAAQEVYGF